MQSELSRISHAVDSDTQFTHPIQELVPSQWKIGIKKLQQLNAVDFGHRNFGDQHHFVYLALHRLTADGAQQVANDIYTAVTKAFSGEKPHLILYPGQSTIHYVISSLRRVIDSKETTLTIVAPAHDSFGNRSVRIELSAKHFNKKDHPHLRCAFIDDSRMTGSTESSGLRALAKLYPDSKISWFSYFVLADCRDLQSASQLPRGALLNVVSYSYQALSHTTLLNISPAACCLCRAHSQMQIDSTRSSLRRPVRDVLNGALAALMLRNLTEETYGDRFCSTAVLAALFDLAQTTVARVALRIQQVDLLSEDMDKVTALAIIAVLRYDDLRGYLSPQGFLSALGGMLTRLTSDQNLSTLSLILIATLPLSTQLELLPSTVNSLLRSGQANVASSICLIVQQSLRRMALNGERDPYSKIFALRSQNLPRLVLNGGIADLNSSIVRQGLDLAQLDLVLYEQGQMPDLVRDVANVATLLEEGRHSLTLERLKASEDLLKIKDSQHIALMVLSRIQNISSRLGFGAHRQAVELAKHLQASIGTGDEVAIFEEVRSKILRLWKTGELFEIRYCATDVKAMILAVLSEIQDRMDIPINTFEILDDPLEVQPWVFLGPPLHCMTRHLENLLVNTLRHSGVSSADRRDVLKGGWCKIAFAVDEVSAHFAFIHRGSIVNQKTLFGSFNTGHGLSQARAHLNCFGGDLFYAAIDFEIKAIPVSLQGLLTNGFEHAFVTSMPLLIRSGNYYFNRLK